jgi:murein DD-endopeptidase MepM/ murein hydrolase activator NlpD
MSRIKSFIEKLQQQTKYAASNPLNFEEKWSFQATGFQLISLITIFVLVIGILFTFLFINGPFASYFTKNGVAIDRHALKIQQSKIDALSKEVEQQTYYIQNVKKVVSGELVQDSLSSKIPDAVSVDPTKIDSEPTENEKVLSEKVKSDLRTGSSNKQKRMSFFMEPVKGVISQHFDFLNHCGVDIVTRKDVNVLACLAGTVIFSGYTQKDGFVIIIEHANGYISIYKHNKTLLKKTGARVQLSDPIAIVGNTGENSSGPHLHFELWHNQTAVNPEKYMNFE